MQIAIGSTNPVKCNATQQVLSAIYPDATFASQEVESGVPAQPWGDEQTRQGALNRARATLATTGADIGVGLEAGVQENEFGLFTCAWCAIVDRGDRVGIGGSSCIRLPDEVAKMIHNGQELGLAMDALSGEDNIKQKAGAIGLLTKGLLTRQNAYEVVIKLALAPFLRPEWYN